MTTQVIKWTTYEGEKEKYIKLAKKFMQQKREIKKLQQSKDDLIREVLIQVRRPKIDPLWIQELENLMMEKLLEDFRKAQIKNQENN